MKVEGSLGRLAKGFRERTLVGAKLASKVGVAALKAQLGAISGPSTTTVAEAEVMVKQLGKLKGLMMKFGQMASYMPGATSPEVAQVLARLQAHSSAMEFETIDKVIHAELGQNANDFFDGFEQAPLAAASIGQVHRATRDGQDLAVKVQYPEIEELLRGDLQSAKWIAKLSSVGTAIDGGELAEELRARTLEECDYLREAHYQEFFARILRKVEGAHVPKVYLDWSTKRVLCSEWVSGKNFYEFCETASQAEKDRAARIIFEASFGSIFRYGVFNGDPHPGNYLFHPGGDVAFLDFGCVRFFRAEMMENCKKGGMLGAGRRPSHVSANAPQNWARAQPKGFRLGLSMAGDAVPLPALPAADAFYLYGGTCQPELRPAAI